MLLAAYQWQGKKEGKKKGEASPVTGCGGP
jgi:hypothetical protein